MGHIQLMNMAAFDLNLLKVLDAVLATCSVSAASRLVGLSQPATSAALARLRVGLGDPLLVRHGNRMVLSPRAERLVPRVRSAMREIEQVLAEESFDPATTKRAFRIAATYDVIEAILSTLFISLRSSAPGALIDVVAVSDRVEHDLATGKVDLAIARTGGCAVCGSGRPF